MTTQSAETVATGLTYLERVEAPAEVLQEGCRRLVREGRPILQRYTVVEIAEAVGSVCKKWLDPELPERQSVVEKVMVETGMSRQVVEQGLDVELSNYETECLLKALRSEFGDLAFLDGYQPNEATGGRSVARGPKLIAHWFSSTIPALPALGIVRGLLLKSPGIGRLSSRETAFTPTFLGSLAEFLPGVEKAVWLTTWSPDLPGCLEVLARECEAAIIYGGEETCARLRAKLGPFLDIVEHGHRVGITLIGRGAVTAADVAALARDCAFDVATFDQRACISPQVYLMETGGAVTPARFAQELAAALAATDEKYPGGASAVDEDVTAYLAVEETRYFGGEAFKAGSGWVLLEGDLSRAQPTQGRRTVRVIPVEDLETALVELPFRGYLQNVGLRVSGDRQESILNLLAAEGATRICAPGKMPYPSMMWHHDGYECLARLARWTDIEML